MQKKIIIIGAGEMQVPVIVTAKKLGLYVITIDANINAQGNKYADLALKIDTNDKTEIFKTAKKHQIDGILTTSDYPVRVVGYVCDKLGLSGLTYSAAKLGTNKYLLRNHLRNQKFLTPKYQLLDNDNLDLAVIDYFPVVVKPIDSSASRGVRKVKNLKDLQSVYKDAKKYSKSGEVLIEEFLDGPEYSVETLSQDKKTNIIAITEKKTKGYDDIYFVEDRHLIPANITIEEQDQIHTIVHKAIKAIGLDNSASHTELKLTNRGPVIIEIGARLGGDYITSDLVPLATGVNMLENIINISLGNKIDIEKSKNNFAGIQFVNSGNYYSVKKHIENIKTVTGFIKSELKKYKEIELKNSSDRLGYYICVCDTREGLNKLLNNKDLI